jgi:phosphate transport system ATP-binding protein
MIDSLDAALETEHLDLHYGEAHALRDVSITFPRHHISALIGPSGCGKTSLLRCFNRMNDAIDRARVTGRLLVEGRDIYDPSVQLEDLRKMVGMVFQKSNPFPMTVRDNVLFGPRIAGVRDRDALAGIVERSLKLADLWDEINDRLDHSALDLSGGQQQRLCIARALANQPSIILLDEPASALDPITTAKIENTLLQLKERYTIVIVTHNLQQAARIADFTGFLMSGRLVEFGRTADLFTNPSERLTEDYITGRFG